MVNHDFHGKDAYMSLVKAIHEAAYEVELNIEIEAYDLVANTGRDDKLLEMMKRCDGVIVPGGFGDRAWEDKIQSTKLAREMKIPFIGICYGFQVRHVIGTYKGGCGSLSTVLLGGT